MTLGAARLEFFLWKSWPGPFTTHVAIRADRKNTVTIIPMSNLVGSKVFCFAHTKYHAFQHTNCCDLTLPRNMECCNVKKCRYNHQTSSLPTLSKVDNKMRVIFFPTSSEKIPTQSPSLHHRQFFFGSSEVDWQKPTVLIAELLI